MKPLTTHLPQAKQNELDQIASVILDICDGVEMIILLRTLDTIRAQWGLKYPMEED